MAETTAQGRIILELVSPQRVILQAPVEMAVIPGSEGAFAVLKGHAPFIAALKPGVVEIYEGGKVSQQIFVDGGFAEVSAERCVVLAETAIPATELNRAEIAKRVESLKAESTGIVSTELPTSGAWPDLVIQQAMLAAAETKTI